MRTVFVDIDTQNDFMLPAGALYVPGAEQLIATIARLNRYAAGQRIPLISTADAHAENDVEFRVWPPHCVAGTIGQQRQQELLLSKRATVPSRAGWVFQEAEQYIVEKQALDCFTNANLAGLLDRLGAERCVVYGVVTEYCVKCAAAGLLKLGKRVEVVTDAIRTLNQATGEATLAELRAQGAELVQAARY